MSNGFTLPPQQAPQLPWKHTWRQTVSRLEDESTKQTPGAFGTVVPRSGRVNKLDAELLDAEVADMIRDPVSKAFSLLDSRFVNRYRHELDAAIHAVLFCLSVGSTKRRATYGQMVQNLAYAHTSGFSRRVWALGVVTILGRYAWRRMLATMSALGWANQAHDSVESKAWRIVQRVEKIMRVAALVNFVAFLGAGQYRTIAERLLGLRLVSARPQLSHSVSFEFLNRQLVWHAFTEFVMFAVPLVNPAKARAWMARQVRAAIGISASAAVDPAVAALPDTACAICAADAEKTVDEPQSTADLDDTQPYRAINPYITPCAHTYCYVCIKMRMMTEANECTCLRCGKSVDRIYQLAEPVEHVEPEQNE
ncbi:peroxisome assembly protein (Peroxin-2) [Coemansia sp. RSA 1813]|nr:peroxisome assembly protein (Peroxin-2) [Coemansia sp. RSA 1646]KAJ1770554.1 peroxisome assembly protein (Peroxin-2) [Coemansia sp. RSA 1843]KAJ2216296.1 peroxisome assembly protein (Peroxin-2) [Coemansia sp. RSA 487]KAJ2570531.1 peroxisome assembly protein (Peroxin-2) [Coemansia sp. RSA 1813]